MSIKREEKERCGNKQVKERINGKDYAKCIGTAMREIEEIEKYYAQANIGIVLKRGFSELKKNVEACPECVSYSDDSTLLHIAAAHGTPEMIQYLVEAGSEINCIKKEWTPLCFAVSEGNIENVKMLIKLGAEVNIKESAGSPILSVIYDDNMEIVKILTEAGTDLTYQFKTKDNPWWDVLSYAEYYSKTEIAEYIKEELMKQNRRVPVDVSPRENAVVSYMDYVESMLGKIVREYGNKELLDKFWDGNIQTADNTKITIYEIVPYKECEYSILITSGMSEFPMAETDPGLEYAEVMMKVPNTWITEDSLLEDEAHNWTLKIMSKAAYLGHISEKSYIDETVVVPYGIPDDAPDYFDWDKEFTSVMLCPSEEIRTLEPDETTRVKFYTLVPITDEEAEMVKEQGSAVVRDMLPGRDMVDMDREPLAEPEQ